MDWIPTIEGRRGPAYQRIVDALADDIASGRLHQGKRLPTHRALAQSLGLDVTTITRAYVEAGRLKLVEARVGRGTFVKAEPGALRRAAPPSIDLSMILPPMPEGVDLDGRIAATLTEIRRQSGFAPYLAYQQAGGSAAERGIAAEWLRRRLPGLTGDRLLIAPGTQAALAGLLLALAAPGETVLCESLTYPGLKGAADLARIRLKGVALDSEGVVPDALERASLRDGAKLVVLTPTMHNPTTATMSASRRAQIAELIAARGLTLIEDDPYFYLDPDLQPLALLIPERTYLAATLSKCIAPGLRTSLLVTPSPEAAHRAGAALRATMQMSVPLMTAVAVRWINNGTADTVIDAVRAEAASRQRLCRDALGAHCFIAQTHSPHAWLPAPETWSSERLSGLLRSRGLGVVGSDAFAASPDAPHGIRLALGAAQTRGELEKALGIVRDALRQTPPDAPLV